MKKIRTYPILSYNQWTRNVLQLFHLLGMSVRDHRYAWHNPKNKKKQKQKPKFNLSIKNIYEQWINKEAKNMGRRIFFKQYLRSEASDCREACIAASSYANSGGTTGWVCGGVNNGTLFTSCGGNSIPADCQLPDWSKLMKEYKLKGMQKWLENWFTNIKEATLWSMLQQER